MRVFASLSAGRLASLRQMLAAQGSMRGTAECFGRPATPACQFSSLTSMAPQHKQQQGQRSWMLPQRHTPHQQRLSSASASTAAAASEPPPPPKPEDIVDLPAKLTLLEEAGIAGSREELFRRFSPFLCSPAHHISTRLAFLRSRGKLTDPPRLWKVICPSDAELCELHKEAPQELAAFKRQHLAGQAWADFCAQHGVQQAQPAQLPF